MECGEFDAPSLIMDSMLEGMLAEEPYVSDEAIDYAESLGWVDSSQTREEQQREFKLHAGMRPLEAYCHWKACRHLNFDDHRMSLLIIGLSNEDAYYLGEGFKNLERTLSGD
ncbi:MAG: hypothetical protein KJ718_02440 [Nanoarchaeota archaeon]|nr:hypothetical protein [Nanoarchaeota archaeon]MBU1051389.1 hypothetical protein [Nanoarchaeota archaeon]